MTLDTETPKSWHEEGFVVNPTALFMSAENNLEVIDLPYEGLRLRLFSNTTAKTLVDRLRRSPSNLTLEEISSPTIWRLFTTRAILPARFENVVKYGLTSEARAYTSWKNVDFEELKPQPVIIGSAVDFAQVGERTSFVGPLLIRKSLSKNIQDIGNVHWLPIDSIENYGNRLSYCIWLCKLQNSLPIILGGDHSLTKYSFEEHKRYINGNIGLIHIDAHNDLGVFNLNNPDPLMHSNVIAHIAHSGCDFIAQAGLRHQQIIDKNSIFSTPLYQLSDQNSVIDFKMYIERIFNIHPNTPVYLSIDIDCIDPSIAPEVTTPLKGGLKESSLITMISMVFSQFKVEGIDLVEVASTNTDTNRAADIAARVVDYFA